jgi:hypothetical protein
MSALPPGASANLGERIRKKETNGPGTHYQNIRINRGTSHDSILGALPNPNLEAGNATDVTVNKILCLTFSIPLLIAQMHRFPTIHLTN